MSHHKEAQSMELYNGSGNRPTSTLAGDPMHLPARHKSHSLVELRDLNAALVLEYHQDVDKENLENELFE
jgi:hypothetical protein